MKITLTTFLRTTAAVILVSGYSVTLSEVRAADKDLSTVANSFMMEGQEVFSDQDLITPEEEKAFFEQYEEEAPVSVPEKVQSPVIKEDIADKPLEAAVTEALVEEIGEVITEAEEKALLSEYQDDILPSDETEEVVVESEPENLPEIKEDSAEQKRVSVDEFERMIGATKAHAATLASRDLRAALVSAYQENPELAAQRRAFQSSVEQVPQALSGALPTATANYSKGRQRTRTNGTQFQSADEKQKSLQIIQPIFRGGSTYANTKSARRNVEASISRLKQVEQSVLLQAITAYMDVVQAEAVLALSEKTRDVLARQLKAASQRFEVGEDTRTDVAQSKSRLALAKSDVINSRGQLASARAAYFDVIRKRPDENLEQPKYLPSLPKDLKTLLKQALEYNPQVMEARALKRAADYSIDANLGTLLPSVDLEASMSRQEGVGAFGNLDFDQDAVRVSASMPLYQGGQRYSRIREAKQNYHQRRYQLMDSQNEVERQAISAWEDLQAAIATIESNQSAIEAAKIALDGVRQEQQYGARTTLDVLDAERELFNAEVELVIAQRNRVVAAYSVLAVLGELTAESLGLGTATYDANEYYDDTEYQIIGF